MPDGVVDGIDHQFWRANFGKTAEESAAELDTIPEPAAMWMITMGILLALAMRRGR
jgi:hypothetical protein